jgi:WD40 repeat protein/tetratricopeptide (TPR) repeat protein
MSEADTAAAAEPITGYEFPSLTILKQRHLELLEAETESANRETPAADFLEDVREFMYRASATGRVLDDDHDRGTAQTLLNYWATVLFRAGVPDETVPPTSLLPWDETAGRDLDDSQCPYCGVHAYTEASAHLFFGRQRVVARWVQILQGPKLVLVALGASGSGKTSLVRAGVLPALRKSAADWQVYEETLKDVASAERLLAGSEQTTPGRRELLIIHRVDEGLLAVDPKLERRLISGLRDWLTAPNTHRKALLVGRIESSAMIGKWLREGDLSAQSQQEVVPPFEANDLRTVILEPAERIGLRFDEGVVDMLINDFVGDPSALALLQFTLLKLWARRTRNRITWDAYEKLGGGRGVVEKTAEDALIEDQIDPDLARQVLLKLVRPTLTSALAVNTVPQKDLAPNPAAEGATARLVDSFEARGLLRTMPAEGGDRLVEVAQEALMRKWPRFLLWLEDARHEMLERRRIAEAAAQWRERDRHPSALWTGILLSRALPLRNQLPQDQQEFIDASRRALTQRRLGALVALAIVAALLAYFTLRAYYKRGELETALNVERGERLLASGDPAGAFLYFNAAARKDPSIGNDLRHWAWRRLVFPSHLWRDAAGDREALHDRRLGATWWPLPRLKQLYHLPEMTRCVVSRDGKYMAGTANNKVAVWAMAGDAPQSAIDPLRDHPSRRVLWASFSHDADQPLLAIAVAATGEDGRAAGRGEIVLFNPATQQLSGTPIAMTDGVPQKVWFGPAGSEQLLVISRSSDAISRTAVRVWNWRSGKPEGAPLSCAEPKSEPINWATFSPDGNLVAIAAGNLESDGSGEAKIWDWRTGDHATLPHDGGPLSYVEFDSAGTRIATAEGATGSDRGATRVWAVRKAEKRNSIDVTLSEPPLQIEALTSPLSHQGAVTRARFSPDGLWLASASRDRTTRLWHIGTQKEVYRFREHGGDVNDIAFSPDGRYLASAGRDRNAYIWELATGQLVQAPLNHSETVAEISYSRDGRSLVTASKHLARIWATDSAEPKSRILQMQDAVLTTVSESGQHVLSVSGSKSERPNTLEIWSTSSGDRLARTRFSPRARVDFALLNQDGSRCAVVVSEGDKRVLRILSAADGELTSAADYDLPTLLGDAAPLQQESRDVSFPAAQFNAAGERLALVLRRQGQPTDRVALCDVTKRSASNLELEAGARVNRLEFSSRGKFLLGCYTQTSSERGRAKLWRTDGSPAPSSEKLAHDTRITTAAFNRAEDLLLTGSTDDNAWLWRISEQEVTPAFRLNAGAPSTHTADVTRVRFSPDDRQAITAARDQTAMLWDLSSEPKAAKRIAVLNHSASVTDATYLPQAEGNLVLTFSGEPTARLWSTVSGKLVALLKPPGEVMQANFTPDGQSVVAIQQNFLSRPNWSGAQGEEQFSREIRPLKWRVAPLTLPTEESGKLAVLLAGRQIEPPVRASANASGFADTWNKLSTLLKGRQLAPEIEKAETEALPEIWADVRSTYEKPPVFRAPLPDEKYFEAAAEECEATKQWYAAAWHLSRLLEMAPDDTRRADLRLRRAEAYASAGMGAYAQGDNDAESFRRSIADRNAAIALGRNTADDYVALARVHRDYGNTFPKAEEALPQWDAAVEAYRKANEATQKADVYLGLGETLAGKREYEAAYRELEEAFKRVEAERGDTSVVRARLALVAWLRGDKAKHREHCLFLNNPEASTALLWPAVVTNAFEGDAAFMDAMVKRAHEMVQAAPANYFRLNNYGAALYRAGRYEDAIRQLEIARTTYLADRANQLSRRYDRALRVPIAPSVEGRTVDLLFLAMANAKLGRPSGWDWLRKARETPELSQIIRQSSPDSYPTAYANLGLELLYKEALDVLRMTSTRRPGA